MSKASKRLHILRVLKRNAVPPTDLIPIHIALIRSVLEYCAPYLLLYGVLQFQHFCQMTLRGYRNVHLEYFIQTRTFMQLSLWLVVHH